MFGDLFLIDRQLLHHRTMGDCITMLEQANKNEEGSRRLLDDLLEWPDGFREVLTAARMPQDYIDELEHVHTRGLLSPQRALG